MIYEIYDGQRVEAAFGDVVFSVFKPNTTTQSYYQHASLIYMESVSVNSLNDDIEVIGFIRTPVTQTWPNSQYEAHLIGKMYISDQLLPLDARKEIIDTAEKINRRVTNTIDNINDTVDCDWNLRNYKTVESNFFRFTCSGFVEYCYEEAGYDIVNDGEDGKLLPEVDHPDEDEQVHRLFPGYQIKAFKYDKYPLDFDDLRRQNIDPKDYQYYTIDWP